MARVWRGLYEVTMEFGSIEDIGMILFSGSEGASFIQRRISLQAEGVVMLEAVSTSMSVMEFDRFSTSHIGVEAALSF